MVEMNIEQARHNMVEQQIRTWEVLDQRVLDTVLQTPREDFVPAQYRNLAFSDLEIPLGHGQVMMPPKLEARLLQSLSVQPGERILEVGTGSGYLTALLARQGGHVVSVEIIPELLEAASGRLATHGIENITLECGDAVRGWPQSGPYDVIAVTGSVPTLTEELQQQLRPGGRLFVIIGEAPVMEAILITRSGEREFHHEALFETVIPPLVNAPRAEQFRL